MQSYPQVSYPLGVCQPRHPWPATGLAKMEEQSRHRRVSSVKSAKLELLRKIKEAKQKGERFVVETEEKPVYETVDEKTYSRMVQERLEDDWIVDDEGLGYADDGREIFDDNDGDAEASPSKKRPRQSAPKKRFNPDIRASPNAPRLHASGTKDIRNMFATSASQKSKSNTGKTGNLREDDAALDELLAEIVGGSASRRPSMPSTSTKKAHCEQKRSKQTTSMTTTSPKKHITNKEVQKNPFSLKKSARSEDDYQNDADTKCVEPAPLSQHAVKRPTLPTPIATVRATKKFQNSSTSSYQPKPEPMDFTKEQNGSSVVHAFENENMVMETDDFSSCLKGDEDSEDEPSTATTAAADVAAPWMAEEGEVADEVNDPSALDYTDEEDKERLNFFWFDAYEDSKNQPGVVFLFGKVRSKDDPSGFVSCCVRVKDLERRLFFLPRPSASEQEFTVKEVYQELRELTGRWKIGKFKCKPTVKKYAFEFADVPSEAEYLEVRYSVAFPALPTDLSGETFSRVFGANTSFLENLILDLRLRGPCWLELTGAVPLQPQISWCKVDYDFSYQKPNIIMKLSDAIRARTTVADGTRLPSLLPPPPPLRLVALDIKSVVRRETNSSEIIAVGLLIDNHCYLDQPAGSKTFQSHYLVLSPPKGSVLPYDLSKKLPSWGAQYQPPKSTAATGETTNSAFSGGVDIEPNERALLGRLLTRIHRLDPDLIVGHDLWGHQLDLLLHRLNAHKVPHWHRISRLRRSAGYSMIFSRGWFMRNAMPGRLICDSRVSAKELIRSRTYNLSELAHQVLPSNQQQKRQIPPCVRAQFSQSIVASDGGGGEESLSGIDLEVDSADLRCLFASSAHIKDLIDFCLSDALLVLRLVHQLQALPLANQITTICGNVLSRTLAGGRSERNEALLLHAFNEQGYLVPDPPGYTGPGAGGKRGGSHQDRDTVAHETLAEGEEGVATAGAGGRRKPAYAGGLVLEPKKGFYDSYILLLDFNSLYPSIIQEFNLCFTTMDRSFLTATSTDDATQSTESQDLISALIASVTSGGSGGDGSAANSDQQSRLPTSRASGILPMELRRLVDSRREVKKLIAAAGDSDPVRCAQWNIRQMALKITANSVYGCLGFAASRFCARGLAALVTGLGRALLVNTRDIVENMDYEVVYGDTDSIMVNTNSKDLLNALAIGEKVKHEVNRRFRLVELDTDGVFAAMLLLAKKKYAALSIVNPLAYAEKLRARQPSQDQNGGTVAALPPPPTKAELKGLDIVRRDWCRLAAQVGRACVDALLSGKPSEEVLDQIHTHLRTVAEQVRQGTLSLPEFVITKMLTKNPEDYPDAKLQPHVQVALRFNQATNLGGAAATSSSRRFRAGDTVEYIICEDGTNRSAVQRAYSPAEMSGEFRLTKADAESDNHDVQPVSLKVDVQYYLAHQIHPVVSRLVAPIEGTSPAHIADCLGLDPTAYRRTMASAGEEGLNDVENYDDSGSFFSGAFISEADPLRISCPHQKQTGCTGVAELRMSPFSQAGLATWVCPKCGENLLKSPSHACAVVNKLVLQARRHVVDYEAGWLVCEDPACGLTTRNPACPPVNTGSSNADDSDEETRRISGAGSSGLWTAAGRPLCPACGGQSMLHQRYSEAQLYRQLIFFRHLLEPTAKTASEAPVNLQENVRQVLQNGLKHVYRLLAHSAFAMVDLGHIFAGLRMRTTPGAH